MKVGNREILKEARGHGACAGETEIVSPCNSQPCDWDCHWSDWTEEAACSKSCGGGTKTMKRNIVRNSSGNGLACTGEASRLADCNEFLCPGILAAIVVLSILLALAIIGRYRQLQEEIQSLRQQQSPQGLLQHAEHY